MTFALFCFVTAFVCYVLNSSRKNPILTALMYAALALGVGAVVVQTVVLYFGSDVVGKFIVSTLFGEDTLMAKLVMRMFLG